MQSRHIGKPVEEVQRAGQLIGAAVIRCSDESRLGLRVIGAAGLIRVIRGSLEVRQKLQVRLRQLRAGNVHVIFGFEHRRGLMDRQPDALRQRENGNSGGWSHRKGRDFHGRWAG